MVRAAVVIQYRHYRRGCVQQMDGLGWASEVKLEEVGGGRETAEADDGWVSDAARSTEGASVRNGRLQESKAAGPGKGFSAFFSPTSPPPPPPPPPPVPVCRDL